MTEVNMYGPTYRMMVVASASALLALIMLTITGCVPRNQEEVVNDVTVQSQEK